MITLLAIGIATHWQWFFTFDLLTAKDFGFWLNETAREFLNFPLSWWSKDGLGWTYDVPSVYPFVLLYGIFAHFNVEYAIYERLIFAWPIVIAGSLGSYLLLKKILQSPAGILTGYLVYNFNTFFLILQTSHWTLAATYAVLPLYLYLFIDALEKKSWYLGILTGLVGFIISFFEFRLFYLSIWIFLFYFLINYLLRNAKNIFFQMKRILMMLMVFFIVISLNAYWLINYIYGSGLKDAVFLQRGLWGNSFFNLSESFTLFHPFWTGTNPLDFVVQPIPIFFWLIPIFAFLGLITNIKNRTILFFGLISLIGILLSKQVANPWPDLYPWLFDHFPGFNAFREASKFYLFTALGYSVLIGSFVAWLWKNWNDTKWKVAGKYAFTILIVAIFLWNSKPLVTSEIRTLFVPRHIPNDYLILKNFILQQPGFFRTFWTPRESRWAIYTNEKPKIGNVALVTFEWKEFVAYSQHDDQWPVKNQIVDIFNKEFSDQLFDVSSIKYIILPIQDNANEDDFFYHYGGVEDPAIRDFYLQKLDAAPFLKRIDIGTKELLVYENENHRPHIYTTAQLETITQDIPFTQSEHSQVNSTQYSVILKNISQPIYINFSESFHPDWKLRVGDFNWYDVFNKNYFLPDDFHVKNDAMLNSFKIDPDYIRTHYPPSVYTINTDGSIDLELTLYFKPQSYFYLGLIISVTTLIGCLLCLVFFSFRSVREKMQQKKLLSVQGKV